MKWIYFFLIAFILLFSVVSAQSDLVAVEDPCPSLGPGEQCPLGCDRLCNCGYFGVYIKPGAWCGPEPEEVVELPEPTVECPDLNDGDICPEECEECFCAETGELIDSGKTCETLVDISGDEQEDVTIIEPEITQEETEIIVDVTSAEENVNSDAEPVVIISERFEEAQRQCQLRLTEGEEMAVITKTAQEKINSEDEETDDTFSEIVFPEWVIQTFSFNILDFIKNNFDDIQTDSEKTEAQTMSHEEIPEEVVTDEINSQSVPSTAESSEITPEESEGEFPADVVAQKTEEIMEESDAQSIPSTDDSNYDESQTHGSIPNEIAVEKAEESMETSDSDTVGSSGSIDEVVIEPSKETDVPGSMPEDIRMDKIEKILSDDVTFEDLGNTYEEIQEIECNTVRTLSSMVEELVETQERLEQIQQTCEEYQTQIDEDLCEEDCVDDYMAECDVDQMEELTDGLEELTSEIQNNVANMDSTEEQIDSLFDEEYEVPGYLSSSCGDVNSHYCCGLEPELSWEKNYISTELELQIEDARCLIGKPSVRIDGKAIQLLNSGLNSITLDPNSVFLIEGKHTIEVSCTFQSNSKPKQFDICYCEGTQEDACANEHCDDIWEECGIREETPPTDVIALAKPCDVYEATGVLPESFSWANYHGLNFNSGIRNQGHCGSCWSFGTVSTIESMYEIEQWNPNLDIDLSEQNLVSNCCLACGGCDGGVSGINIIGVSLPLSPSLNYIKNDGIVDENCFEYTSTFGEIRPCNRCSDYNERLWKIDNYRAIYGGTQRIKEQLLCNGPFVTSFTWPGRDGAVHVVSLSGWDNSVDDGLYDKQLLERLLGVSWAGNGAWIVKNSWGLSSSSEKDSVKDGYYLIDYKAQMGGLLSVNGVKPPEEVIDTT